MPESSPQPAPAPEDRVPSRLLGIVMTMAAAVTPMTGCYHLVMPVNPPRLPDELATLQIQPRRTVLLINAYAQPKTVWFRAEGLHLVGADLREWTDRLLSQLQIELEPRGVSTLIVRDGAIPASDGAALRVRITHIEPPYVSRREDSPDVASSPRGPLLEATIVSGDGEYRAEFSSGATAHGFSDALYNLKESILVDGNLAAWFRRSPVDS